jgi:hypothetical protein
MLNHLRDIESDMSAIHGITNIWAMDGPRFFAWAYRLPAYKGVMRALAEKQASEQHRSTGGRDIVPVAAGELGKIEGLTGVTRNNGDGMPWLSIEQATD